jgi:hypothetical protein
MGASSSKSGFNRSMVLLAVLAGLPLVGGWQATKPPPQVVVALLAHDGKPAVGVPIVFIDNTPEHVFKSVGAGVRTAKPGEVAARGKTNDKGEFEIAKIKKGTYAYEAGDPEKWGYANGVMKIEDEKKNVRFEYKLSEPVK